MVVLGSGRNFLPLAKFGCARLPSVLPDSARRRGVFWWLDMSIAFICCICKGRVARSWQWLSMATFFLFSTICCIRACPRHSYVERRVVEGRNNKKMTQHVYMSTVFIAFNILFCRLWGGQVQNWLNMAALFVCELKMDTAFVREREGRKIPLHGWNYWKLNLSTAFIPRKYLASLAVVILIQTWVKMPISWFAQRIVF